MEAFRAQFEPFIAQVEPYVPKDSGVRAAAAVLGATAFYFLSLGFYRLFLSPLAKFPGPKLAAVSGWYELYYDVIKSKGKYIFEIEKMHDKYGEYNRLMRILSEYETYLIMQDPLSGLTRSSCLFATMNTTMSFTWLAPFVDQTDMKASSAVLSTSRDLILRLSDMISTARGGSPLTLTSPARVCKSSSLVLASFAKSSLLDASKASREPTRSSDWIMPSLPSRAMLLTGCVLMTHPALSMIPNLRQAGLDSSTKVLKLCLCLWVFLG
jgi:hypothetical protein